MKRVLSVGSLFAGIGGIEKGLEDTGGFKTVWQVELDDYARRVLAKHWPDVRRWDDVRTFPPEPIDEWRCDLICGGPPCQPTSYAGNRRGREDARWLWPDTLRIIRTLRPTYAVLENPTALLDLDSGRAFGAILGSLAESGYDAEWDCLFASDFGVRQRRDRCFVVAYARCGLRSESYERPWLHWEREAPSPFIDGQPIPNRMRITHRATDRVDLGKRIKRCSNAVVPQVAEWIGRRILEAEES